MQKFLKPSTDLVDFAVICVVKNKHMLFLRRNISLKGATKSVTRFLTTRVLKLGLHEYKAIKKYFTFESRVSGHILFVLNWCDVGPDRLLALGFRSCPRNPSGATGCRRSPRRAALKVAAAASAGAVMLFGPGILYSKTKAKRANDADCRYRFARRIDADTALSDRTSVVAAHIANDPAILTVIPRPARQPSEHANINPNNPLVWYYLLDGFVGSKIAKDQETVTKDMVQLCKAITPDVSDVLGKFEKDNPKILSGYGTVGHSMAFYFNPFKHIIAFCNSGLGVTNYKFHKSLNRKVQVVIARKLDREEYQQTVDMYVQKLTNPLKTDIASFYNEYVDPLCKIGHQYNFPDLNINGQFPILDSLEIKNGVVYARAQLAGSCSFHSMYWAVIVHLLLSYPNEMVVSWDRDLQTTMLSRLSQARWFSVDDRSGAQLLKLMYNIDVGITSAEPPVSAVWNHQPPKKCILGTLFEQGIKEFDKSPSMHLFFNLCFLEGCHLHTFALWNRIFDLIQIERVTWDDCTLLARATAKLLELLENNRTFSSHAFIVFAALFAKLDEKAKPEKRPISEYTGMDVSYTDKIDQLLQDYGGYALSADFQIPSMPKSEGSEPYQPLLHHFSVANETSNKYIFFLQKLPHVESLCFFMNIVSYENPGIYAHRDKIYFKYNFMKYTARRREGHVLEVDSTCVQRLYIERSINRVFAEDCVEFYDEAKSADMRHIVIAPFTSSDNLKIDLINHNRKRFMRQVWDREIAMQLATCSVEALRRVTRLLFRTFGFGRLVPPDIQIPRDLANWVKEALGGRRDQNDAWVMLLTLWADRDLGTVKNKERINTLYTQFTVCGEHKCSARNLNYVFFKIFLQWLGSQNVDVWIDLTQTEIIRASHVLKNRDLCSDWVARLYQTDMCHLENQSLTIDVGHRQVTFNSLNAQVFGGQYTVEKSVPDMLLPWLLIRHCLFLRGESEGLDLFFWNTDKLRSDCKILHDQDKEYQPLNPDFYLFKMTPMGPVLTRAMPGFECLLRAIFLSGQSSLIERYKSWYNDSVPMEVRSVHRHAQIKDPDFLPYFSRTYNEPLDLHTFKNVAVRGLASLWASLQSQLPKFLPKKDAQSEYERDELFIFEGSSPDLSSLRKRIRELTGVSYQTLWEKSKFHIGSLHSLLIKDPEVLEVLLGLLYLEVMLAATHVKEWTRLGLMSVSAQVVRDPWEERPAADALLEVTSGLLLRRRQVDFVDGMTPTNTVRELLMGMGKSRMIIPLFAIRNLFQGKKVIVVQPRHLLHAAVTNLEAALLSWMYHSKLTTDLANPNLLAVVSDEHLKEFMLRNPKTTLLEESIVLFDEVDFMYSPTRSELNIPVASSMQFHLMTVPFKDREPMKEGDVLLPNGFLQHRGFKQAYIGYLLGFYDGLTVDSVFPDEFRAYLGDVRSQCLKMTLGEHFGPHPRSTWALPFQSADSPLVGSMFSNTDLLAHLTCLTKKRRGFTEEDEEQLRHLRLQDPDAWDRVSDSKDRVRAYLEFVLLPDMNVATERENISFIDVMAFTKQGIGLSGTHLIEPPEELGWPNHVHEDSLGNSTIKHFIEKGEVSDWTGWAGVFATNVDCIIDESAMTIHGDNREGLEGVLAAWNKIRKKEVVYIDETHTLRVWPTRQRLAGAVGDRLVFFDQAHTVGVDLVLDRRARAAVLVKPSSTFSSVAQAMFRMRGLRDGQTVQFIRLRSKRQDPLKTLLQTLIQKDADYLAMSREIRQIQVVKATSRLTSNNFGEKLKLDFNVNVGIQVQKDKGTNVEKRFTVHTDATSDAWKTSGYSLVTQTIESMHIDDHVYARSNTNQDYRYVISDDGITISKVVHLYEKKGVPYIFFQYQGMP